MCGQYKVTVASDFKVTVSFKGVGARGSLKEESWGVIFHGDLS